MHDLANRKAKGAFVSESALHIFDGDKPNSVGQFLSRDDHLSLPSRNRRTRARSRMLGTVMRRYPRIKRAGCPSSVLSCTAWGFSCLANYSASGELLPRLFTLACTLLPKNRRCLFCDTLRHRSFSTATPARFTRHAAVWCSDFPLTSRKRLASDHLPSANNLSQRAKKKTPKAAEHPKTRAC